MSSSTHEYVPINDGLRPASQLSPSFFSPTPPTDDDLLPFRSVRGALSLRPGKLLPGWLQEQCLLRSEDVVVPVANLGIEQHSVRTSIMRGAPPASSSEKPANEAVRLLSSPREPARQLVCRDIRAVDELIMAWNEGVRGYPPLIGPSGNPGGVLNPSPVKMLSKCRTVIKKVNKMGREAFREMYEKEEGGKRPSLRADRTRIERENRRARIHGDGDEE